MLVNLFDVFHGCQHQFMSVLWFLSVRMKKQRRVQQFMDVLWFLSVRMEKQDFSHFDGCFKVDLFVVSKCIVSGERLHMRINARENVLIQK